MESITVCVIDSVLRISGLSQLCINLSHKRIPSKHTTLDELRNSGVEHVPSLPVQCPHLKKQNKKKTHSLHIRVLSRTSPTCHSQAAFGLFDCKQVLHVAESQSRAVCEAPSLKLHCGMVFQLLS